MNKFITLLIILLPFNSYALSGMRFLDEKQRLSIDWQLDPYYSQTAFNMDLKDPEIMPPEKEKGLYVYLLKHFFDIRSIRLEASINPLPVLGSYYKRNKRDSYDSLNMGEANLINILTEGFPEPGAISLFIGDRVYLGNQELGVTGAGVGGFLLSYGGQHIVNNTTFSDDWFEGEMKVKGASLTKDVQLSYSYRLGAKIHDNHEIRDTMYMAMKRSHSDKSYRGWSPTRNSVFEIRGDIAPDNWQITRMMAIFGKKFASSDQKRVYSLDLGVIWVRGKGYSGRIAQTIGDPGVSFLLRPNITF